MKKAFLGVCMAIAAATVFAQETQPAEGDARASQPKSQVEKASWPVWLAFNSTKDIDVIGLRITIPYGSCESVTGFDLGFFGRCRYFEGFQLNILRNDVSEAHSIRGVQVGLINVADAVTGVQLGIINRSEALYGFQGGVVNVIRESEMPFCPILNVGFDTFTEL